MAIFVLGLSVCHVDLIFLVHVIVLFMVLDLSSTRYAPNSKERQDTPADKLSNTCHSCLFKVAVQNRASHYDEDGEHHKLRRNHLGRIESLQRAVDILDLHDRSEDEHCDEEVG